MPNRIIKDSICTSENIDQLTAFQETVFYRLMVNCDDYGRMDARPMILASRLFPLREKQAVKVEEAIKALVSNELVMMYEVDGKPYLQLRTWEKHQQIRAHKSKFPAPEDGSLLPMISSDIKYNQAQSDDIKCPRNPIQSESNPNPNTNTDSSAKTRFTPPTLDDVQSYCKERNNRVDAERFIDYYASNGWKVGKNQMKDWRAAVRNWERDDKPGQAQRMAKRGPEREIIDDWDVSSIMNRPRA